MTATLKDYDLFGNGMHKHQACCMGCTMMFAENSTTDRLLNGDIDGIRYLTNRYLAIRADLVKATRTPYEETVTIDDKKRATGSFEVPPEMPPASRQYLDAMYMDLLDLAGFTICEGGPRTPQPVYLGEDHVGWLMPLRCREDVAEDRYLATLADLPELRRIADHLPVLENDHPMVTAARLLRWERARAAAREAVR